MNLQGQSRWTATGMLLVVILFAHVESAQAQLRIVTYNTANGSFSGNNIFPRTGMDVVLEAIGDELIGGIAKPIDALILQEQADPSTSTQAFVDLLNGIYGAGTYARSTVFTGPSFDALHQSLVYNTQTLSLISETAFGQTGTGKAARQTGRFQLRPVGYSSSADLYIYNDHYKASTGSDNQARRNFEAQTVRANADALGQGAHAIYAGDYNIQSSSEAMYQTLLGSGNGQAFDPISTSGTWHNSSSLRFTHTQSPASSQQYGGQVTGGMDDRFDFQLVTGELLDNEGLSYIPGSYHAFGNNGSHACCNSPITSGNGASSTVLNALMSVSDHLPVVADYQLPAIMNAQLASIPSSVGQGALVNIDVMIENIANVLTSSGADELDYTLSVSGDLFGNASGTDFALGSGNTHLVTLDTSTMGPRSGTITVTSNSQAVGNGFFSFPVSYTVGEGGSGPTFGIIAKDTFDTTLNRNSFSQSPAAGAFSSAADGFETFQVGVSATIPYALVDDSAVVFPADTQGIVDSATKTDAWFGIADVVNGDNPSGLGTATWEFDISGATGLQVSIDMGAMGDFDAAADTFDWTYAIDGEPAQSLFASSVDASGSATYTLVDGDSFTLDDPLQMTTTGGQTVELSNLFQALTSLLEGTGNSLVIELTAITDDNNGFSARSYAFDNIIIEGFTGVSFLEADFNADGNVDGADLAQWQGDFGLNENSDADGDSDSDGADFLVWQQQFGTGSNSALLSQAVPEPSSALLLGIAFVLITWRQHRASEYPGRGKPGSFSWPGRFLACSVVLILSAIALAGPFDPPVGYYNSATGTGSTLKGQLTSVMSTGHIQRSYGDFRYSAAVTDADPDIPGNILLAYNRTSVSGVWNLGGQLPWNREHIWPQSRQPGSASNGIRGNLGDPHALRPADTNINSNRANMPFGFETTIGSHRSLGSYYFPGDADKGDTARQLFYSDTRYASSGLSLTDSFPSGNQMGDRSSLLAWHYLDPPDEFERRRNQAIYSSTLNPTYYTNNRNAYIDRPEYVWSVYVDQQNDSRLYVGSEPAADGSSTLEVDLGSVLVGANVPSAQNTILHKSGFDGTYYEVASSGDATSSVTGRHHAFAINNTGSDSSILTVGLNTNTFSAGSRSGSVTIDNLDITTGAGTGHGENDGNDLLNISLNVLDHANASFSDVADLNTLLLDLGSVAQGSATPTWNFDLFNLESTTGFTAAMELDSILSTGDTSTLTTDLTPLIGEAALDAGMSNTFTALFDTSVVGEFSASYTLRFSDEDLSGANQLTDLLLTLSGTVENAVVESADFDADSDIDGADFLTWQRGLGLEGSATLEDGDANEDQTVDMLDLTVWQQRFGTIDPPSTVAVPEPSSLNLLAPLLLGLLIPLPRGDRTRNLSTSSHDGRARCGA
ncbi:MAG: endonuclease [Pirellulales bacterium]